MNGPWNITLLGSLRAEQGEKVITRFKSQKVASLLAYLAYHLRQAHSREILIEMLWPESDAPTLRNSLSVALSTLRHQFEPPGVPQGAVIRADRFSVGLNPATVTTDVAQFEQAIKAAARAGSSAERVQYLTEAVELYQGPLLPDFYEEWITSEQERLAGLFFDAVGALIAQQEQIGDLTAALSRARHAVAVDPLREEGQLPLIRLLNASGQPGAALRAYKEYERLLEEETGEEPSAALRALFRQIEKETGVSAPPAAGAAVPVSLTSASRTPVPFPTAAAFVGGPATITFLMSDMEGSTRLFQQAPQAYAAARERHHHLLRDEFDRYGGKEIREAGDGFVVAFGTAGSALACAVAAQKALWAQTWPSEIGPLRVRMALHTGDVHQGGAEDAEYQGLALHHASRMLTAAHGGQILVSEATAGLLPQPIEEVRLVDLGVYRLRDVPEAKRLFQVEYPQMPQTQFGPLSAEAGHRSNLPLRFTRFFGREQEIGELHQMLLFDDVRLVTLTGPGGNGKTRLALEVAERLTDAFAGAVYFAPLADLSDSALTAGVILDSLGVPRSSHQEPLEQALEALARKPTLLVLDNFEHLVEGGGVDVIQTLLSGVPSLKLLVTSRQVMGIFAEREFVLAPLPVPGTDESAEHLSLYESVQLFIDRAQQVIPYFQVNNANAPALAALVAGLEGIPLAIELAAARVQVLTPAQMLSQLSDRFDFLATRRRDAPERQRTLRGAVDWSYRLLAPELQRFFSRLSVFRGGWTVEEAEVVCEEPLALDYLEQLRECSLVLSGETEGGASFRFRMLETLRQYGHDRLEERGEAELLRRRHGEHFLVLVEAAEHHIDDFAATGRAPESADDSAQKVWLERLELDYGNVRAALEWSLAHAGNTAVRLAGALYPFWFTYGYWHEGRRWLGDMMRQVDPGSDAAWAKALCRAGMLAWAQDDYEQAQSLLETSLALYRELDDEVGVSNALNSLGNVALRQGDFVRSIRAHEEAVSLRSKLGATGYKSALTDLGIAVFDQGDQARGLALLQEGVAVSRTQKGRRAWLANALRHLERAKYYAGDSSGSVAALDESLALFRQLGHRLGISSTLEIHGLLALRQKNDLAVARSMFRESLEIRRDLGDRRGLSSSLAGFAALASREADHLRVARLLGAAQRILETIGGFSPQCETREREAWTAAAREALGAEAFDARWAEGEAMPLEEAISYALEDSS